MLDDLLARSHHGSMIADGIDVGSLRSSLGLTQSKLADNTGLSISTIRKAESGGRLSAQSLTALAAALGVEPRSILQTDEQASEAYYSVFISYGDPDREFATHLYKVFHDYEVKVFFFPVSATVGQRLHRTMSEGIRDYDRVVLICSKDSLTRSGVQNEIEQVLIREAEEGGSERLIPITIDRYVFDSWQPDRKDMAMQICSRVVVNFTGVTPGSGEFFQQCDRLLQGLRREQTA